MPNKDKTIAAAQNRKGQTTWRRNAKSYKEWKKQILAQWQEHNVLHVTKQADGGWRIALEHTAEGDRITAWIALQCGLDPDTVIQNMVGEVLVGMGGKWIPTKKVEQQ